MTDAEPNQPSQTVQEDAENLKYMDFVQVAAVYVVVCFSAIYEYAKENSGPLKPGVQTVEDTVKTVIGPVYDNLHDVPFQLLLFIDRKVDESITEVDRHVPILIKQVSSQAISAAQKVPEVARAVVSEVQRTGVVDAASNIAKAMYTKYEPVAEQYAVMVWSSLNQLPLFPQVAHIMVPTVAYWAEKYNQTVAYLTDEGYTVSYYTPMIPIERIGKVFQAAENGTTNVVVG